MSRSRELALTGALLCATGALLGVPALLVPGIAALLATGTAALWVSLSARAALPELSCDSLSAEEGERVEVRVRLPRRAIPFPGGTLSPWPGAGELGLPLGRRAIELDAQAVLHRRGRHTVGPARVEVGDPFGLASRELLSETSELLVLPRVEPLDAAALAFLDGPGRASPEAPLSLDSLRAHRPGSPASRIHWPTVARSGVLMEHALRPEEDARVLIELQAGNPQSEEALDRAIRATASLCVHLARRGGCLVLLPEDTRPSLIGPELAAWPALHARLALLEGGRPARANRAVRHGLSLIRVSACAEAEGPPAGPHLRVAAQPLAGAPTLFATAGCSAQLLEARSRRSAA